MPQKLINQIGERICYVGNVPNFETLRNDPTVRVIQGNGRTLMSGLGDAHTHFTWNETALGNNILCNICVRKILMRRITDNLGAIGVEEHTISTARSAMIYLDSGYTMYVSCLSLTIS